MQEPEGYYIILCEIYQKHEHEDKYHIISYISRFLKSQFLKEGGERWLPDAVEERNEKMEHVRLAC
jgi:hypothetical protein